MMMWILLIAALIGIAYLARGLGQYTLSRGASTAAELVFFVPIALVAGIFLAGVIMTVLFFCA